MFNWYCFPYSIMSIYVTSSVASATVQFNCTPITTTIRCNVFKSFHCIKIMQPHLQYMVFNTVLRSKYAATKKKINVGLLKKMTFNVFLISSVVIKIINQFYHAFVSTISLIYRQVDLKAKELHRCNMKFKEYKKTFQTK